MADVRPLVVERTAIDGLLRVTSKAVTDERATVREFFRTSEFAAAGVPVPPVWAQVNLTRTHRGALRGLHGEAADKLIGVAYGTAFGAWLDARRDSPSFGTLVVGELAAGVQMFVPAGVCNGFQATSEDGCEYLYCFGVEWSPNMAGDAFSPLDPGLAIEWPIAVDETDPSQISAKDAAADLFPRS